MFLNELLLIDFDNVQSHWFVHNIVELDIDTKRRKGEEGEEQETIVWLVWTLSREIEGDTATTVAYLSFHISRLLLHCSDLSGFPLHFSS